jgi:uncharacterized membrane protein HdeD (DUF308 family)
MSGVLAFVVGLLILLWPDKTAMVVTGIIGVYLIVTGLGYVVSSFGSRTSSAWGRTGHLLLGILYIAAGVLGLTNLSTATSSLATILAILVGALWVVEGFIALTTVGMLPGAKGWTVLFALLTILAGVLVLLSPMWAAATLWWLLGLSLVVLGVIQIVRALAWNPPARQAPTTFGPPVPFPR